MANEITKVTDQNGVDHPFKDVAAFPRSEQAVLGAKSLRKNEAQTTTISGITFTVNDDLTVLANGTAEESEFHVSQLVVFLPSKDKFGDCILSGCPEGGSPSTYNMAYQVRTDEPDTYVKHLEDNGNGVLIPNDYFDEETQYYRVGINIREGQTVNNLLFKPMIRLANDPDDTYVPFAMTNKQLTEAIEHGGGTTVVPNPIGTTTGDLTKVQIGTDIYNIPDTTYSDATTSASGLMSSTDKTKLNGIANNANNYSLPTAASGTKGGIKVGDGLAIANEVLSNPSLVYSTTEKVVGKWTDGSAIYQKTFTGTMPSAQTDGTEVGGSNEALGTTLKDLIDAECVITLTNGGAQLLNIVTPLSGTVKGSRYTIFTNASSSNKNTYKMFNSNTAWNGASYKLTLRYTKP